MSVGLECINRIRGLLAEFRLVFPRRPEALRKVLLQVLALFNSDVQLEMLTTGQTGGR